METLNFAVIVSVAVVTALIIINIGIFIHSWMKFNRRNTKKP